MIKAILLDIDGTLTNDDKVITPATRDALLSAQDKGVILVLASGRANMGLTGFADVLRMREHNGVFVCFNALFFIPLDFLSVFFGTELPESLAQGLTI